ncbi:MAG: glycosyltransferase family 4 protein, partial [Leptolyngbya sp. SIO4C5]|nr:glycosyltransferase family 4 protein [Leptolyngbya sp. SIO4C5]
VLISVSYHTEDVSIAKACLRHNIPFAILLHCASPIDWITHFQLQTYRSAYLEAQRCFFVSAENQAIMETLLAAKLPQAKIVDNPLKVNQATILPWPQPDPVWRLACVGRIHFRSKGQDLILQVLQQAQWRDRPVEVIFWGRDQGNQQQLEELARLYGIQAKICFGGFANSPAEIWRQSHALLLPSRFEGMPMVTAEAMLCGRIAIVTACGRNPEWVDEGETGFLAAAPTVACLGEVLEKAWQRRHDWQEMGALAAERLQQRYSHHPVQEFVAALEKMQPEVPS